jgi:2Fe-2S type ferredoxin (ISC system)
LWSFPHPTYCPDGAVIDASSGESICDALLQHNIDIEHACEKSCACTTCHVVVREGFHSLGELDDKEEDLLDMAWGCRRSRDSRARLGSVTRIWSSRSPSTRSTMLPRTIPGSRSTTAPEELGNGRSVRWNLQKLIGEYAHHNCHADLICERIDGQTGE